MSGSWWRSEGFTGVSSEVPLRRSALSLEVAFGMVQNLFFGFGDVMSGWKLVRVTDGDRNGTITKDESAWVVEGRSGYSKWRDTSTRSANLRRFRSF